MNIAIYGASNPIASDLLSFLSSQGHNVVAMSRSDKSMSFDLRHFASNRFSQFDLVLHLAHDYKAKSQDFDLILDQHTIFLEKNETPFLYFSSMSSHPDNESEYSYQKCQMEKVFSSFGHAVVRLGLVFSGRDSPETNRPIKQIRAVLRYVRFPMASAVNSPKFFLTSFQDIESTIASKLQRNDPASIQDVYSIGPLSGPELSLSLSKESGPRNVMTFPIDLVLKFMFLTPFYDKFLNLSKGMKTTPLNN